MPTQRFSRPSHRCFANNNSPTVRRARATRPRLPPAFLHTPQGAYVLALYLLLVTGTPMPMRISSLISSLYDRSSSFKEAIRHAGGAKTWLSSLGDPFVVNLDCPSGHESIMLKLDKPVPAVAPAPPPPAPEAEEGVAGVGVGDGDGDEDDEGLPAGLPPPPARVPFGGGVAATAGHAHGHDDDDDLPRGLPPPPGKVLSWRAAPGASSESRHGRERSAGRPNVRRPEGLPRESSLEGREERRRGWRGLGNI